MPPTDIAPPGRVLLFLFIVLATPKALLGMCRRGSFGVCTGRAWLLVFGFGSWQAECFFTCPFFSTSSAVPVRPENTRHEQGDGRASGAGCPSSMVPRTAVLDLDDLFSGCYRTPDEAMVFKEANGGLTEAGRFKVSCTLLLLLFIGVRGKGGRCKTMPLSFFSWMFVFFWSFRMYIAIAHRYILYTHLS